MKYLIGRTIGIIIVCFFSTCMWINHKRKGTVFIKREIPNEKFREKRKKTEKRLDIVCVVGLLYMWIFITIPCILDVPYLFSGNLKTITGTVIGGDIIEEDSIHDRSIEIRDDNTNKSIYLNFYEEGIPKGIFVYAKYLPHTKYGYILMKEEEK